MDGRAEARWMRGGGGGGAGSARRRPGGEGGCTQVRPGARGFYLWDPGAGGAGRRGAGGSPKHKTLNLYPLM